MPAFLFRQGGGGGEDWRENHTAKITSGGSVGGAWEAPLQPPAQSKSIPTARMEEPRIWACFSVYRFKRLQMKVLCRGRMGHVFPPGSGKGLCCDDDGSPSVVPRGLQSTATCAGTLCFLAVENGSFLSKGYQ